MPNTCGYGKISDGRFSSICLKGKEIISNKNEAKFRSLNVNKKGKFQDDVEICGNLNVKGVITQSHCNSDTAVVNCNKAFDDKKIVFDALESQYKANGSITWSTFASNQFANKNKVVTLQQSDFDHGTLRVHQPCLLKLTESVEFNPNRPSTWLDNGDAQTSDFSLAVKIDPNRTLDWFPNSGATNNAQYFEPEVGFAYSLGFFAAIAIETCDVILDLCGYTLSQHPEHALQQRFFAIIELADQPFMPLQGPSNFGAILKSAKNTIIKNGRLGLSSHHAIHGNDCDEIMIYNVQIENFEVAGVALNGCNGLYMKNVNLLGNRKDVPILGTYSGARFVKRFVEMVQTMSLSNSDLDNAMVALDLDMEEAFNDIIFSNGTTSDLFKNVEQVVDGTCYGFLINPKGVAVNTFLDDRNNAKAFETTNIHLINCSANNIKGNIREIIGLAHPNGGMQVDTAGALLQFFNGVSTESAGKYTYVGTTLSEVQIELSKIKKDLDDAMQNTSFFGTLNIHPGIHLWQMDNTNYFEFIGEGEIQLFYENSDPILIDSSNVVYDIKCNGDSMFHVNKGVMGYRIDGASTICLNNCSATNIENIGAKGSELCGAYTASHPATVGTKCIGYTGADTHGAVFNAINDAKITNFTVNNVVSGNACAHGINIQNGSLSSCFTNIVISDIESLESFDPSRAYLPNMPGSAVGLGVRFGCQNINLNNISVDNVSDNTPFKHDIKISDPNVTYN